MLSRTFLGYLAVNSTTPVRCLVFAYPVRCQIFPCANAGAVKYLQQRYDLTSWQMRGASAGALVATLAACNVSPDQALICADRLARENGIFERKLGLAGTLHGLSVAKAVMSSKAFIQVEVFAHATRALPGVVWARSGHTWKCHET